MLLASDYDKSKYFKGTDLDREKKFRIKIVTSDELTDSSGKKEKKLICWFTNDERGLVLNKTNLRTLKGAFGDNVADWATKVIVIFPMMADNGKPGLRVRILPPKQAAAASSPSRPVEAPSSGNGSAATAKPVEAAPPVKPQSAPPVDPELEPDPKLSTAEELDDEIPF
jgi:hypothetical protein